MAKSTKALLMGRIQMCKTNPSIAHIGLATHGRSIQIGSSRFVRRPVLFRIGGVFDSFHRTSPSMIKRLIGASLRIPEYVIVQSQFAVRATGRTSDDFA
jgi:hypothetical protein